MPRFLKGGARFFLVTAGIIALTSFTIDATDMLSGSQSALGILADRATGNCPEGMVEVDGPDGLFCIDEFEVSVGPDCPNLSPRAGADTALNINNPACLPVSIDGGTPWTYVARHQAESLCAKAGKRLPNVSEWYIAALGTPDSKSCNTNGNLRATSESLCRSGSGAYDMIGNVWELTSSVAQNGEVDGRNLPLEGYVSGVDERGVPNLSSSTASVSFNDDYVWTESEGEYAIMRGGFYGGGSDAGIYAVHAKIDLNFNSAAIGFRCAQSI